MIKLYRDLKSYCQTHEWAAGLSALILISLVGFVIYTVLAYHSNILNWLFSNLLLNSLLLLMTMAALSVLLMSVMCLSFSQCNIAERTEQVVYRHQPRMSDEIKVVKNLGANPRHRRT